MIELIGNTPLIQLNGIWIKCEFSNPTGSSKDRIAYSMLKDEARKVIIEASSGNTGVSVAFVCSILNKKCIIMCPRNTSIRKIAAMRAYGAEVDIHNDDIEDACDKALSLMDSSNTMRYIDQFTNEENLKAQVTMAKEIVRDGLQPDAIVCGIGTGGTLAGLHTVFPAVDFYTPIPRNFSIEGICDGVSTPLKPKSCNLIEYSVERQPVKLVQRELATRYGVWVGLSSAANYYISRKLQEMGKYNCILIIGHDNGWRYI